MVTLAHLPGSVTMPAHYTKTERLFAALVARIESGEFPPGSKLPSGSELCAEYDVSMQVVRRVTDRLKDRGVIEGVAGSGWYVREPE